jgi:polyisoprenoid-binding protein YceI
MRDRMLHRVVLSLILVPLSALAAPTTESWYLPVELSDMNTSVGFVVDSTWHTVHGVTSGITGVAKLSDQIDPASVNIMLNLPVAKFDTDNGSRDKKLRRVMAEDKFPKVRFEGTGLSGRCNPKLVIAEHKCSDLLKGKLTIRDISKDLSIPVLISFEENRFLINGSVEIDWSDFGVEDPSILIATVSKKVKIDFSVVLRPQT